MEWYVYYHNFNKDKIEKYNVFDHYKFNKCVNEFLDKCETKEEFAEELEKEVKYYFLYCAQWELVIEMDNNGFVFLIPWVGSKKQEKLNVTNDKNFDWVNFAKKCTERRPHKNKAKFDVFSQLDYVWDNFVNYCWSNKEKIIK